MMVLVGLFPPVPMAARCEVFQFPDAPTETSSVPEDVSGGKYLLGLSLL